MSSSIFGRIEAGGRALAPFISSVAIILVGMTFSSFPGFGRISPCFGLMATYYWAIHRPDLLPLSATFALGLLTDLLSAAPAGMHALIYILVQWILVTQRRFFLGNTFLLLWWGFALIATAADVLEWAIECVIQHAMLRPSPLLAGTGFTIVLFPPCAWLFMRVQRNYVQRN